MFKCPAFTGGAGYTKQQPQQSSIQCRRPLNTGSMRRSSIACAVRQHHVRATAATGPSSLHWPPSPCAAHSAAPQRLQSATAHRSGVRTHAGLFDGLRNWIQGASQQQQKAADDGVQEWDGQEGEGEEEENTMVPIETEGSVAVAGTAEAFGPLAVLLVGFMQEEVDTFRAFMQAMDGDMVKIIPCSKAMLDGTLQEAVESEFPSYETPPLGVRRVVFMSGMYGSEVVSIVASYRESGLPSAVFAAAVPRNYGRTVGDLVADVVTENNAMMQRSLLANPEDN